MGCGKETYTFRTLVESLLVLFCLADALSMAFVLCRSIERRATVYTSEGGAAL